MIICLIPVRKIDESFYRKFFYFANSLILLIFSFHTLSLPIFVEPTIQIIRSITTPIKVLINQSILKNIYFNPDSINNKFILIDTASSLESQIDSATHEETSITSRGKLANLLCLLKDNQASIGRIVCDVRLQKDLLDNSELLSVIRQLKDKIILIADEKDKNLELIKEYHIPIGWVSYNLAEGYVFNVPLEVNDEATLPYLMYKSMSGLVNKNYSFTNYIAREVSVKDSSTSLIYTNFIPEMYLTEKDYSENSSLSSAYIEPSFVDRWFGENNIADSLENSEIYYYLNMNQLLVNDSRVKNLIAEYKYPIIFIGGFSQSNFDIHSTPFGQMHGSTILINIFISFLNGQHEISYIYIILLYTSFFGLSVLLLKKPYNYFQKETESRKFKNKKTQKNKIRKTKYKKLTQLDKYIKYIKTKQIFIICNKITADIITKIKVSFIVALNSDIITYMYIILQAIFEFIFDNKIYLLLLLIILSSDILFDHMLNIIGLSVHFLIFSNLIERIIKYEVSILKQRKALSAYDSSIKNVLSNSSFPKTDS